MHNEPRPIGNNTTPRRWVKSRSKTVLAGWLTLLCLSLSILVFFSIATAQRSQRQAEMVATAQDLSDKLETQFQDYLGVLTASERFVMASDQVTHENFAAFTREFLDAYPGILGLSWNPGIKNADRPAFEQRLRDEGFPDFSITERRVLASTGARSMGPADQRDLYYPVGYIVPYVRNASAHGFDTYAPDPVSKNARRLMLDLGRDEGRAMATGRVSLVQADNQYGMLIYNPVYDQDLRGTDAASRREHLLGYIGGPFLLSEIVRPVAQLTEATGSYLILRDIEAPPDKQLLYDSRTTDQQRLVKGDQTYFDTAQDGYLRHATEIEVAGRKMEISLQAPISQTTMPWLVLAIGVLISAAVGAVSYFILSQSEEISATASEKKRSDRVSLPALTAFIGLTLSAVLYLVFEDLDNEFREEALQAEAQDQFSAIRKSVDVNLSVLGSVKSYFDATKTVDRAAFQAFVRPLLQKNDNAQAIEWVPRVSQQDRATYEAAARADGLADFSFQERQNGSLQIAGDRETYYPVFYIEPALANRAALGFDLASNARRFAAMNAARDSGDGTATSRVTLIQNSGAQTGLMVFSPIYDGAEYYPNLEDRQRYIKGFVLIVLRAEEMITTALEEKQKHQDIVVTDITDPGNAEIIYSSSSGNKVAPSEVSFTDQIEIGGREWLITITPHRGAYSANVLPLPMIMLLSGLIFTTLLTFIILQLVRRREVVEHLVLERTDELRDTASRLQTVMNTVVDGVISINEMGIIHSFNRSAENIFGLQETEALHQPVANLIPDLENEELQELLTQLAENKQDDSMGAAREINGRHRNGSLFAMELGINDMWTKGVRMFVLTVRDISSRKRVEGEKILLIEQLTLSNEELARFAFICSHDLQEPLRMIRSFSEKLQSHMGRRLDADEKGKRYFRFITEGAARAQDLISGVLEYSSIDTNTRANEDIDLEEVVQTIKANLHENLTEWDAQLTHGPLPHITGNKTQIYQLFQNLIINGLKYQPVGSKPEVHIQGSDLGDQWHFSIQDNGIGMDQRHLSKIFDVFQRLNRQSLYSGTGIGLSICKKVVERHGGRIWVASEPGAGSTFYFLIQKPSPLEAVETHDRAAG